MIKKNTELEDAFWEQAALELTKEPTKHKVDQLMERFAADIPQTFILKHKLILSKLESFRIYLLTKNKLD
jgi:hypothetical protein